MPKNSFFIEDILESAGSKKRTLSQFQSECPKTSPSLSPASLVSSTSTSSLSDESIPHTELDMVKYHYLKNAYPSIFFNQFFSPMPNLFKSEDSLALFSSYYSQLVNGHKSIENDMKMKRMKLDGDRINSSENEHVSPLDKLLNLANNINKSALVPQEVKIDLIENRRLNSSNSSFDGSETIKPVVKQIPGNSLKRKRKNRTAFTANQIFELEKRFSAQKYLSPHDRDRIAYELQLTTAQVITWFQNRRAKQKRDLEELKNDVNAAKIMKVVDAGLDVDKIIVKRDDRSKNENRSSDSDFSGVDEDEEVDEEVDVDDAENYSNLSHSMISSQMIDDDCGSTSSVNK